MKDTGAKFKLDVATRRCGITAPHLAGSEARRPAARRIPTTCSASAIKPTAATTTVSPPPWHQESRRANGRKEVGRTGKEEEMRTRDKGARVKKS